MGKMVTKKPGSKLTVGSYDPSVDRRLALTRTLAQAMAQEIIEEMKRLIANGISPIREAGRFPEYKGVGKYRAEKALSKGLKDALKVSAGKGARDRKIRNRLSRSAKAQKYLKSHAYPYSVQKKYPGKLVRPVNLKLSGQMLDSLGSDLISKGAGFMPAIKYLNQLAQQKEQGHRDGANGQPKRPTLPKGGEQLAVTINQIIDRYVRKYLKGE